MQTEPHKNYTQLEMQIEQAIRETKSSIHLDTDYTQDEVRKSIRIMMRRNPDIFWFSHQYKYVANEICFSYNFSQEKILFFKNEIEKVVTHRFFPERVLQLSELERVVYVYKWINKNTTYNVYSSFNQTIYSVLINRNSVCTGYAKTAQYLLAKVGIEAKPAYGHFLSDSSTNGRHAWTVVKIDGQWYHIDFCLADESLAHLVSGTAIKRDGLIWNYFGVSTQTMKQNRTIEEEESLPICEKSIDAIPNVSLFEYESIEITKSISGTQSKIVLGDDKYSVIKKVPSRALLDHESSILQQLHGRHIVKLIDSDVAGIKLEQITPWSELLNSPYYNLNESQLRDILQQLIEGLFECQKAGITYYDIHYNNVLIDKDGTVKWCDFGLAYPTRQDHSLPSQNYDKNGTALGSRWFMAPETLYNGVFNEASCVYGLCMIAYFVMNDMKPPFFQEGLALNEILNIRLEDKVEIPAPIQSDLYHDLWRIIQPGLSFNAVDRYHSLLSLYNALGCPNCLEFPIPGLDDNDTSARTSSIDCYLDLGMNDSIDSDDSDMPCPNEAEIWNDANCSDNSESYASTCDARNCDYDVDSPCPVDSDIFAATCGLMDSSNKIENWTPEMRYLQYVENCAPSIPPKTYRSSRIPTIGLFKSLSDLFSKFRNLFRSNKPISIDEQETSSSRTNAPAKFSINSCVYAPSQIKPHKPFVVRIFFYQDSENDAVKIKVAEIDRNAVRKEYKPLDLLVKKGDRLGIQLKLSKELLTDEPKKEVTWQGHFTDCSFIVTLQDRKYGSVWGKAAILINDVPAGEMLFTMDVVAAMPHETGARVECKKFTKIFISYAHADITQVQGIAEGCKINGVDYFFDRHSLNPGDKFKDIIMKRIDTADLFILCWSKNAAKSEWVQLEREYALDLINSGAQLALYPLSLKPEAPLPEDMASTYHFKELQ